MRQSPTALHELAPSLPRHSASGRSKYNPLMYFIDKPGNAISDIDVCIQQALISPFYHNEA